MGNVESQIFNSIIGLVAIPVMNYFPLFQSSAKMFLHHPPMLLDCSTSGGVGSDKHITIQECPSTSVITHPLTDSRLVKALPRAINAVRSALLCATPSTSS